MTGTPAPTPRPDLDEVELKAAVPDPAGARRSLEAAGATLVFEGRLEDRRYDSPSRALASMDHVLRLRVYRDAHAVRGSLDWKGPTRREGGYKVREELSAGTTDPVMLAQMLERLGYIVTREIDRQIVQFRYEEAVVRFEHYPRMDVLVEVEGPPSAIERAIAALGMDRVVFSTDRLLEFILRFQARTGTRAAVSDAELRGEYRFLAEDS